MKKFLPVLVALLCAATSRAQQAYEFDGVNDYVTFGTAAGLGASNFTLECWVYKKGAGSTTTTGTGGIAAVIPVISKGRGESDGNNKDMNYLLGINSATGAICADFEEGTGQPSPGLNHPVYGTTALQDNVWYHIAVTFDGTVWTLYLNGEVDGTASIGVLPQSMSIQHAGLATAMTSSGATQGFFQGIIDEVRIWNVARTEQDIKADINKQITTATGLIGRWSMDDPSGTTLTGTGSSGVNGTLTNGPTPVGTGAPYNVKFNAAPDAPTNFKPADKSTVMDDSTLQVTVSDPDTNDMKVIFMGREKTPEADSPNFTIIPIPDTQYYTSAKNGGNNEMFKAQTQWMVDSMKAKNIVYSIQLGDCVENGDNGGNVIEWRRADTAMSIIENPNTTKLPDGIPYGICVGNHDQTPFGSPTGSSALYNTYFGSSRFQGRKYYGGHYGNNNDNHFQLFSASGYDFICISLEYDVNADADVLSWADSLLKAYPKHRAIIASHFLIEPNGAWGNQGMITYHTLKNNTNLFLMLCAHRVPNGETMRADKFKGNTVYTLLSDFQDRANGGSGWMRSIEFVPRENKIYVKTFSPVLGIEEKDANSEFTLDYMMTAPFDTVGIVGQTASGSNPKVNWNGLKDSSSYEWYVIVSDGKKEVTSEVKTFTYYKTVGVPKFNLDNSLLSLFPNPNDGKTVTLSYPKEVAAKVMIVDASGKRVYNGDIMLGKNVVLPVQLTGGAYILNVQAEGKTVAKKLIVQ